MKKIAVVFGTRPEAIKMCPLVKQLQKSTCLETVVCVSGQHREMLQQVMDIFGVTAQHNLDIMKPGQDLFDITSAVLTGMRQVFQQEKPDVVLVHGDTTTAFSSAMAAFYLGIPVGHVEAGLRTWNLRSPFPEEFNRQSIGLVSKYHFAPTQTAKKNLLDEGKREEDILVTGNTGIDALFTTVREDFHHPVTDWAKGSRLLAITAHRRENLGRPMHEMFRAICRILEEFPDVKAVYPIHMNPQVRKIAREELAGCDNLRIIEPLPVDAFHNLLNASYLILTDSGGIQEEAPSLGKPVLVMRDPTERPEGVQAGTLRLTGTGEQSIYTACRTLLTDQTAYRRMSRAQNPYGDGKASARIRAFLERRLCACAEDGLSC